MLTAEALTEQLLGQGNPVYLSEYVFGTYSDPDGTWIYYANTETGQLYTSKYFSRLKERMEEKILARLGLAGKAEVTHYAIPATRLPHRCENFHHSDEELLFFRAGEPLDPRFDGHHLDGYAEDVDYPSSLTITFNDVLPIDPAVLQELDELLREGEMKNTVSFGTFRDVVPEAQHRDITLRWSDGTCGRLIDRFDEVVLFLQDAVLALPGTEKEERGDDMEIVFDYYEGQAGLPVAPGYDEITLTATDDPARLRMDVYTRSTGDGEQESRTSYLVSANALADAMAMVQECQMAAWNEGEYPGISGKLYVCRFWWENEFVRVSSECMPENGQEAFGRIEAVLFGYIDPALVIEDPPEVVR